MERFFHSPGRGAYFEGWYFKLQTRGGEALALIPALHQDAAAWDGEHLRAWLLRCTVNRCCDLHRFRLRRPVLALEELPELEADAGSAAAELWEAVARLPEKLRVPVHL